MDYAEWKEHLRMGLTQVMMPPIFSPQPTQRPGHLTHPGFGIKKPTVFKTLWAFKPSNIKYLT